MQIIKAQDNNDTNFSSAKSVPAAVKHSHTMCTINKKLYDCIKAERSDIHTYLHTEQNK